MALQDGTYRAKARTWALAESSKGTPEAAVEFVIIAPADFAGQSITWHGYLSEAAFARSVESLRHCGWKGDDLSDLAGLDANEVDIVIANEEYEGETHAKVRWVNKAGGLAVKSPMTPDKAKAFAAAMKGQVRAVDISKGAKPSTNGQQKRAEAPMSGDDIPF